MTRDEWCALPLPLALAIIYDAAPAVLAQAIDGEAAARIPQAPKYDDVINRKGGITWASEYDAEGLRYWRDEKRKSGEAGGEWAEKDAKTAKSLGYWLEWRSMFPAAIWSGKRFGQPATAAAPSGKPTIYPRETRIGAESASRVPAPSLDDDGDGGF